jgi:hypothetical protein
MKIPVIKIGEWKLLGERTIGLTFFPFIFLKKSYFEKRPKEVLEKTIRHESIHIKQQIELLVIPFYLWYFIEYFFKFFVFGTDAYYHLSFEREAYDNDKNPEYLETREFWSFLKYIF